MEEGVLRPPQFLDPAYTGTDPGATRMPTSVSPDSPTNSLSIAFTAWGANHDDAREACLIAGKQGVTLAPAPAALCVDMCAYLCLDAYILGVFCIWAGQCARFYAILFRHVW